MKRRTQKKHLSRRSLAMMAVSLIGALVCTAYFVFTQSGIRHHSIKPVTVYACEKCGQRSVLNNPRNFLPDPTVDNSKNFQPIITHLGHGHYRPIIHTRRLTMREVTINDVEALYDYYSSPETMLSSNSEVHTSIDQTRKKVLKILDKYKTGKIAHWAICLKNGTLIGLGGYHGIVSTHHRATIGWQISSKYWGHGYATEVGTALIEYGFKYLHLNRLDAVVRIDNIASHRVLQKMGLNVTNRFRDYWRVKGELSTFHQFVILNKSVTGQLQRSKI